MYTQSLPKGNTEFWRYKLCTRKDDKTQDGVQVDYLTQLRGNKKAYQNLFQQAIVQSNHYAL